MGSTEDAVNEKSIDYIMDIFDELAIKHEELENLKNGDSFSLIK